MNSGRNNDNGYDGANARTNTPHRSDWNAKITAQRKWDQQQIKEARNSGGMNCGFTDSPAYCYRLKGPYPQELRILRY